MTGKTERLFGVGTELLLYELGDRRCAQRVRSNDRDRGIRHQLGKQRMLVLDRAQGCEYAHRHALEPPCQIRQPTQRRRIRPLQIVDREHKGSRLRQVGRQPVEPVQERIDVLFARVALARSEQARALGCGAAEQPRPLLLGRRCNRCLEELPDDAERERRFQLARAAGENCQTGGGRACSPLREQRRLSDPRRPFDHDQPAGAGLSARDRRVDCGQLFRAFE